MPKFNGPHSGASRSVVAKATSVPQIVEPKCKVCQSPHRNVIDQMLVGGMTYSAIEREMAFANIPRRSISSHSEKHLKYDDAAIREVIEQEAVKAQRNFEEGKARIVTKNAYLEVALQKAYDALLDNTTVVEPKDAVKVIEMLQKLQDQSQAAAIDELRQQFNWFMQAVKEVVPKSSWETIVERTNQLAGRTTAELPTPDEKIVDATVVEPEKAPVDESP